MKTQIQSSQYEHRNELEFLYISYEGINIKFTSPGNSSFPLVGIAAQEEYK